jgi:hypothetical protein
MTYNTVSRLVARVVPAATLIACSAPSPVAPLSRDHVDDAIQLSQPAPGQYDLEFSWSGTQLTVIGHVRDAGNAAPGGGTVSLQYCSYGQPTNDITQPDEAPVSACADHTGHWVTLARGGLDSFGDFTLPFGPVTVVTVIGFRLVYVGQGSGVQNGSVAEDWYRPL